MPFLEEQPDQYALRVGKIAYDVPHRLGQFADQRRKGENLVIARKLRILQEIDHGDAVSALQSLFADDFKIIESSDGFLSLPRDIQAQVPFIASGFFRPFLRSAGLRFFGFGFQLKFL
jgi:hypothetical protein